MHISISNDYVLVYFNYEQLNIKCVMAAQNLIELFQLFNTSLTGQHLIILTSKQDVEYI